LPLTAGRSPWLRGTIRVPGDPLQSQLAMVFAGLARGESLIENASGDPRVGAMAETLTGMGVHIGRSGEDWDVEGLGLGGLLAPLAPLDMSELGDDGAASLIALIAAHDMETTVTGLSESPVIEALLDFFRRNGAVVERREAVVTLRGPRFGIPLDLALAPVAVSLAAPLLIHCAAIAGRSALHLPPGFADPAQSLLAQFGAPIAREGDRIVLSGQAPLVGVTVPVPGALDIAAIALGAALVAPDSELTVQSVALGPAGQALFEALRRLGADISVSPPRRGREGVADITARHAKLSPATIPTSLGVLPDDHSILAVVAAFAEGETLLEGVGVGVRRMTLTRALRACGVECVERDNGALLIRGKGRVPGGGDIVTRLDPKLATAFLVLGMGAEKPVTIDDGGVVAGLFPEFIPAFEHLGAKLSGELAK
jgi:3-phosphoshikimate 1-carboxyvinyltransferase